MLKPAQGAPAGARSLAAEALGPLFGDLATARGLLLAVSGGPDSMALMHLASRWAATSTAGPPLFVATVDHGLRAGSRDEALLVAQAARSLGLPHACLTWDGPKPRARLQERARAARYALLAEHARRCGADHVVTAHHADDQAETVLMRLGRGSGIGGLAAMRRRSILAPGLILARPLLSRTKADLVAVCRDHGLPCVEDPSNADPAFARARLRRQAASAASLGLDTRSLTRLARRMARADEAIETAASLIEQTLGVTLKKGTVRVVLPPDGTLGPEICLRLLRRWITAAVEPAAIRLDGLENLADALLHAAKAARPFAGTLAGASIRLDAAGRLAIAPAPARRRGDFRAAAGRGCCRH